MMPTATRRIPLVVTLMVALGALLTSFLSFQLLVRGSDSVILRLMLPDLVGWPFGRYVNPLSIAASIVALLVLSGLTWLFSRLVSRAVLPGRSSAVFFGVWGAMIVAAWISSILRAPFLIAIMRIPMDRADYFWPQLAQFTTTGTTWALTWGWITALVAALMHRAGGARPVSAPLGVMPNQAASPHPYAPTPYPGTAPATLPVPPVLEAGRPPQAPAFPPPAPPSA